MANENEFKQKQQDVGNAESNARRDQDHGNMNNGTLGGNMGIVGSSNDKDTQDGGTTAVAGDTSGEASGSSTTGSGSGTDTNTENAGSNSKSNETK